MCCRKHVDMNLRLKLLNLIVKKQKEEWQKMIFTTQSIVVLLLIFALLLASTGLGIKIALNKNKTFLPNNLTKHLVLVADILTFVSLNLVLACVVLVIVDKTF